MAICSGSLSLAPEDRVELLAVLAAEGDVGVAEMAGSALLAQSQQAFLSALARADAAPQLLSYCAEKLGNQAQIADALAQNAACPAKLLIRLARHLSAAGIQPLLDNLERLSTTPALVAALMAAPAMTLEQRALIQELQKGAEANPDLEEALAEIEPDLVRRQTLLQRLSQMNVVERVQLALKGAREERMALIRDPNKVVQRAVLQSPRLTDPEVEGFAAMTTLTAETLRLIALNRNFMKNYTITRNLVANSKTPLDISLRLLPRINPRDLKILALNKNIPDTLRSLALKLQRQRSEARQAS